jgi:hypothetical protein
MTGFGPLDLLGTIGKGHDFEELREQSAELEVAGLHVRVLDLDALKFVSNFGLPRRDITSTPGA